MSAATNSEGLAVFTDLAIAGSAGSHTLKFVVPALNSASSAVTLSAGTPSAISAVSGWPIAGTVGTALATAPAVRVGDADGNPVSDVPVRFSVTGGGGAVVGAGRTTNAEGIAAPESWTLGTTVGPNTLSASVGDLAPVTFTVRGAAATAAQLMFVIPPSDSARNRVTFTSQPLLQLQDVHGNSVAQAGVTVTASLAAGGGTLLGSAIAVTDSLGRARFESLAVGGMRGARTLTFAAPDLTSVSAAVTLVAGSPTTMSAVGGDTLTGTVGTALAAAPAVFVADADGNPVPDVAVAFAITTGQGALTGGERITDAAGIAAPNSWTLGTTVGPNALSATASGLAPVTFVARAAPAAAAQLLIVVPPSDSARNRIPFASQPLLQLQDVYGNAVTNAGIEVTATIVSGGGTLVGSAVTLTDSLGRARFESLAVAGARGSRTLRFATPNLASVSAAVTLVAGLPTSISAVAGDTLIGTVGTALATAPVVRVADADDNPVPDIAVTFAVTGSLGALTGGARTTDAAGIAAPDTWTLGTTVGTNTLSATAGDLVPVMFVALAIPAAAVRLQVVVPPSDTVRNRVPFTSQPLLQLQDMHGNSVAHAGVTVTAALAAGGGTLLGSAIAVTDSLGRARFESLAVAGVRGARTLSFAASGLAASNAQLLVRAGEPAVLTRETSESDSAIAGTVLATQPTVRVIDADANVVGGVPIVFTVAAGGGSLVAAEAVSDTLGLARVSSWRLGSTPGLNSLTGTISATSSLAVSFSALGLPLVVPDTSTSDSTSVGRPNAVVALPTGTTVSVVSTTVAAPAAQLVLSEVTGAGSRSGNDATRYIAASVGGSVGDSTTVVVTVPVSDAPSNRDRQWLFVQQEGESGGAGEWIPANAVASSSNLSTALVQVGESVVASALRNQNVVGLVYTVSFLVKLESVRRYRMVLQQPASDPLSCTSVRRFEPHEAAGSLVEDPTMTVVLIHGWQMLRACPGTELVRLRGISSYEEYYPQSSWSDMADSIRKAHPKANVYYVRYSTSAHPSEAAQYIIDTLSKLRTSRTLGPVVLVGHSMGGLVARYVAARTDPASIGLSRIITLGTPHLGVPYANPEARVRPFYWSEGFLALSPNSVDEDIPLSTRSVPVFALRGGVPCNLAAGGSLNWTHSRLCIQSSMLDSWVSVGDGIVLHNSATPSNLVDESYVPVATLTGLNHFDIDSNPEVIGKVVEWLGTLPPSFSDGTRLEFTQSTPTEYAYFGRDFDREPTVRLVSATGVLNTSSAVTVRLELQNAVGAYLTGAHATTQGGIASFPNLRIFGDQLNGPYALIARVEGHPSIAAAIGTEFIARQTSVVGAVPHTWNPFIVLGDSVFFTWTFGSQPAILWGGSTRKNSPIQLLSVTGAAFGPLIAAGDSMFILGSQGGSDVLWKVARNGAGLRVVDTAFTIGSSDLLVVRDALVYVVQTASGGLQLRRVPVSGGAPSVLITLGGQTTALTSLESDVYFSDPSTNSIRRISIDGGLASLVVQLVPDRPSSLMTDGRRIYWTDAYDIWSASLASGLAQRFTTTGGNPRVVGLVDNSVYAIHYSDGATLPGAIWRYDATTASRVQVATAMVYGPVYLDSTSLFYITWAGHGSSPLVVMSSRFACGTSC